MCNHAESKTIRTRCFAGPVSRDENRAAHGNVTNTDECVRCGARREQNINGHHVETGPWGPSLAERQAAHRAAVRAIPAAPTPLTLRSGERAVTASVDAEGYIVLEPSWDAGLSRDDERGVLAALPRSWVSAAQARRRGVVAAAEAQP